MGVPQRWLSTLGPRIALAMCVASPPAAGWGQVVLEGHVVDDVSEVRIPGSQVRLLNAEGHTIGFAVTDDSGYFRFTRRTTGWYRFEVKAIGYQPIRTPFVWSLVDHRYAAVDIRMAPHSTLLAPVEVVALSQETISPVLQNLTFRRTRGFGVQISRRDIEQRHPANITDVLVEVPGVYAARRGSGSSGRQVYIGRALPSHGPCPVQVFLDGNLMTRNVPGGDVDIDQLATPLDVEAIEVFRGLGSIPPEFLTPDARCGVIAIWTKRSLEP